MHLHFSNLLIIHQVITTKITTVKEVWIPSLYKHRFRRFYFSLYFLALFRLRRYIKTLRQCFIGYPNTSNLVKNIPWCFQLSSRCLNIPMKHCFSYLIRFGRTMVGELFSSFKAVWEQRGTYH